MHVIFLIHGLFGNPGHMRALKEALEEALPKSDVCIHVAKTNSALGTFDGVQESALRCYRELTEVVVKTGATEISIIGYSLGGLLGRYIIGQLEDDGAFEDKLTPVLFTTFATPHVGAQFVSGHWSSPILNSLGKALLGPSGRDLFGVTTLLEQMADPDQRYIRGLERFQHRVLFANAFNDRTVPFWTSYITTKAPSFKRARMHPGDTPLVDLNWTGTQGSDASPSPLDLTRHEKMVRSLIMCLLPVFGIVLLSVMAFATAWSWIRRWLLFRPGPSTLEQRLSSAAGEFVDDGLGTEEPGLLASAQDLTNIPPSTRRQIISLNKLGWEKYVVLLRHFNSHGEIVDRRHRGGEGRAVVSYFASYTKSIIKA